MKANETILQKILEGTQQYVVPLFQRPYKWDTKHWSALWDDIIDIHDDDPGRTHFLGSMVTMPTTSVPEGVSKYLLIDGQQRLTTICILLAALRDKAKTISGSNLAEQINARFLVNQYETGNDFFKVLPTQADRDLFQNIIQNNSTTGHDQIAKAYAFFERKLRQGNCDLVEIARIITNRLSIVSIVLDPDDNPYLVFESLNAKGEPLAQSDLIRNYFFMRIHTSEQREIYDTIWLPMQTSLDESLTEFIRHFLMKDGFTVKREEVYSTLKNYASKKNSKEILDYLREIAKYSQYYSRLVQPSKEVISSLRTSLMRLNRLAVTTAYPFLLNCYHEFDNDDLTEADFSEILRTIENFIIRRFVCNIPTNQLNKIFPTLYPQAKKRVDTTLVEATKTILQTKNYPKDPLFRERLMDTKLYGSDRTSRAKLILESLELSHGHKEQVVFDNLTVEHVMPQTMTDWWAEHLGGNYEVVHELYVHTLGNLTLSGYNPELSNSEFPRKRSYLTNSNLQLNRYFSSVEEWNQSAIERRAQELADKVLGIWPYIGDKDPSTVSDGDITGLKPRKLCICGQEFPVDSWRDVMEQTLKSVLDLEPDIFEEVVAAYPHFIGKDPSRFTKARELPNGLFFEVNRSANTIIRFCRQVIETVGLTTEDWTVETPSS